MGQAVQPSFLGRFADEPTPAGVPYDEVLLGADRQKLRSSVGILSALLLFLVFGTLIAQLVNWLGWLIVRPGGQYVDWLRSAIAFEHWWGMLAAHLSLAVLIPISFAVVLFVHRRRPGWLVSVQPWFRWRYLGLTMGIALVVFNLFLLLEHLGQPFPALRPQPDYWVFLVVILLTAPLQAAAEEFFFRGYLLQSFHTLAPRSPWFGVVCSAALFALFHGTQNLPLFLYRFAFGVVVGVLVVKTGGLEAAIGAHVINNILAFGYAGLYSTIAEVKATSVIGWTDLGWGLASFVTFTVLAVLLARRWGLAVTTPGTRAVEGVDPWEPRR